MKLLVLGSQGQLGGKVCQLANAAGHDVSCWSRSDLDICDGQAVVASIQANSPDVVVNAAAWTDVDGAESDPGGATAINADGAGAVAEATSAAGARLIHISTDYVYGNELNRSRTESDEPQPINRYGQSKLAGEQQVSQFAERHFILRTSWLFSATGDNFVTKILRLASEREHLDVVDDQIGKPTSVAALAECILQFVHAPDASYGIYHVAQPESTSWYRFASAIVEEATRQGVPLAVERINPVSSSAFPTAAERPKVSVLDCSKYEETFATRIGHWQNSLAHVITELKHNGFFA